MKNIFEITDNLAKCPAKSILKYGSKNSEEILISIAIPVYNSLEFFKKALASALNQTYKDFYLIVVVDNNHDGEIDNINEFEHYIRTLDNRKIVYYKNSENVGPIHNFNLGILNSNSKYVVMCHEDDELNENCLEELLKFKEKHSVTKELIISPNTLIDLDSNVKNDLHYSHKEYTKLRLWDFFLSSPSNGCGCLINRDAFIKIGGYNPDYRPSADYAMLSLYVYKYGGYRLNNVSTYRYRVCDSNASNKVFYTCIERDEFYRNCMKYKFFIPNFILDRIILANKKCHTEWTENFWLHQIHHPASIMDKIIMKIVKKTTAIIHRLIG